jgi:hypothetical protein
MSSAAVLYVPGLHSTHVVIVIVAFVVLVVATTSTVPMGQVLHWEDPGGL